MEKKTQPDQNPAEDQKTSREENAPENMEEKDPISSGEKQAGEKTPEPEELKAESAPEEQQKEKAAKEETAPVADDKPEKQATKKGKKEKEEPSEEVISEKTAPAEKKAEEPVISEEKEPEKEDDHDHEEDDHDKALVTEINAEKEEEEEEEEEDDDDQEEDEEVTERYDTHSREELITLLEETVNDGDIPAIKTRVALIKVAFLKLTKEEEEKKLEELTAAGGEEEGLEKEPDPLRERFDAAFEKYREKKAKYSEDLEVQKLRNLDSKKEILEEIKELISSEESLKTTYDRFKDLQTRWKEIGMVPASDVNTLWQSYHFLVEKFFDKVKISKELRDLDLKKNLELKIELCEKAEELLLESSIIKSFKQLQKYHEEWKEIGPVPSEKRDEIWERFKTATDKINDRRREYYANLAEEQEKNLVAKNDLCEKAEQLVAREKNSIRDWQKQTREINDLFGVWKTFGPAPKQHNDEVWKRFKTYLNTFFAEKKEYFNELKQEQQNNYNLKVDLCQQAEAMQDSTDWKRTTTDLINLQKEWKKIGPVPKKHSDKVWSRFRAACDHFFNRKSEHFSHQGEEEKENLKKKKELIGKVKDFEFGDDREKNLQTLKEFQREWTNIGFVPIKEKDKIQKQFREAVNAHLDNLNISASDVKSAEYEQHVESLKELPNSDRAMKKEMGFLNGKINKLREDVNLWENNIGFLAHSKRADLLKEEFQKKIDQAKEELELYESKLKKLKAALYD